MKKFIVVAILILTNLNVMAQEKKNIYDFKVVDIDGKEVSLSDYEGKVLLIVNTASECGFTPQYEGLETVYQTYKDQGFEILGFPCNQFGSQEPGTESEIKEFCSVNYGVTFQMFSKIDVNGDSTHPLYQFMKKEKTGTLGTEKIKWNFTKFLINKKGEVVERFYPATEPKSITKDIEKELAV